MKEASLDKRIIPRNFVQRGMAEHIEKWGIPPEDAWVCIVASLKHWDAINCLNSDGSVCTIWNGNWNAAASMLESALLKKLASHFCATGELLKNVNVNTMISDVVTEIEKQQKVAAEEKRQARQEQIRLEAENLEKEKEAQRQEESRLLAERERLVLQIAAAEHAQHVAAETKKRNKQMVEERKQNKASRLAAAKADWIEKYGSQRLKRCVSEAFDYEDLYVQERLARERKGWCVYPILVEDVQEPVCPKLGAFVILDKARIIEPSSKLKRYTIRDANGQRVWRGDVAVTKFIDKVIVFGMPKKYHKPLTDDAKA